MGTKRSSAGNETQMPVTKKRIPGVDKGKTWIAKDFDLLSERELANWYELGHLLQTPKASGKER